MAKQHKDIAATLTGLVDARLKKYESGDQIWEEFPVSITEFVDSPKFLDWKSQIYPGIKEDLEGFTQFDPDGFLKYREAILIEGYGSGKSRFAAIVIAYFVYRLLCLRSPQLFYGLAAEDRLQIMNFAPSEVQAQKAVFSYTANYIASCAWFKEKGYFPNAKVASELQFPKNIFVTPGSSSVKSALGLNILLVVFDEMAFFDRTKERDEVKENYDTITGRMRSRVGDKGVFIGITSARAVDDFVEERFQFGQAHPNQSFVRRRATWDSKGEKGNYCGETFDFPVTDAAGLVLETLHVPIEFKQNFDENPLLALRNLGGRASHAVRPFFKEFTKVLASININRIAPYIEVATPEGRPLPITPLQLYNKLPDDFVGIPKMTYCLTFDLAKGERDKVGFALGHKGPKKMEIKMNAEGKPVSFALPTSYVDLMGRFAAQPGFEIDFDEIREFINLLKLERSFNITTLVSDTWQSLDFRQLMTKAGYNFIEFSVDRNRVAYDTLQGAIYGQRLDWYRFEPILKELQNLEDFITKIDHTRTGSKDIADCLALLSYFTLSDGLVTFQEDKARKFGPGAKGLLVPGIMGQPRDAASSARENIFKKLY